MMNKKHLNLHVIHFFWVHKYPEDRLARSIQHLLGVIGHDFSLDTGN